MSSIAPEPQMDKKSSKNTVSDNRSMVSMPSRTFVHAKLEMTDSSDSEEREADQVAEIVASGGKVMRKPSSASTTGGIQVPSKTAGQISSLKGLGQPMPSFLKSQMESSFGADFSSVRFHTDGTAAEMSSSIGAKAFTHGNDVFFNEGEYRPSTMAGQQLIAHELTHVLQGTSKVARVRDVEYEKSLIFKYQYGRWGQFYIWMKYNHPNVLSKQGIDDNDYDEVIEDFAEIAIDIFNEFYTYERNKQYKGPKKDKELINDDFDSNQLQRAQGLAYMDFFNQILHSKSMKEYNQIHEIFDQMALVIQAYKEWGDPALMNSHTFKEIREKRKEALSKPYLPADYFDVIDKNGEVLTADDQEYVINDDLQAFAEEYKKKNTLSKDREFWDEESDDPQEFIEKGISYSAEKHYHNIIDNEFGGHISETQSKSINQRAYLRMRSIVESTNAKPYIKDLITAIIDERYNNVYNERVFIPDSLKGGGQLWTNIFLIILNVMSLPFMGAATTALETYFAKRAVSKALSIIALNTGKNLVKNTLDEMVAYQYADEDERELMTIGSEIAIVVGKSIIDSVAEGLGTVDAIKDSIAISKAIDWGSELGDSFVENIAQGREFDSVEFYQGILKGFINDAITNTIGVLASKFLEWDDETIDNMNSFNSALVADVMYPIGDALAASEESVDMRQKLNEEIKKAKAEIIANHEIEHALEEQVLPQVMEEIKLQVMKIQDEQRKRKGNTSDFLA